MRVGPSEAVLASAASWQCRVSSSRGATLLAGDVPVLSGRVSAVGSDVVPEKVTLQVPPRTVEAGRTVDWLPRDPGSPLARFGQIIDVTVTVGGVDTRIGRYLITDWSEQDDGSIQVTGKGILQQAEDDRLLQATGPRDGGTLKSEFLRMLPGYLTAGFGEGLVDRAVPKTMEWDENRLDNLYQVVDAWPARLRTDVWGQVQVEPALPAAADPVLVLRDGGPEIVRMRVTTGDLFPLDDVYPDDDVYPGSSRWVDREVGPAGSLVGAPTSDSRAGAYNVFVARSSADGVEAQAVATVLGGPMDPTGPYRPVPKFFASPLLLTTDQCMSAAVSMRDSEVRKSRVRKVTFAPDPRPELDDPIEVVTGWGTSREFRERGYVIGYDLPLTVADGPSRVDVAVF